MSRKVFTAGEVLAAADVNSFLMDQTVMSFAGTAARGSAIGTAVEGMYTHLEDTDRLEFWNGSSWLSPHGLTLLKTQTVGSGVSSVVVADAFNSRYNDYKIIISGMNTSDEGVGVRMSLSGSTGSTYNWAGNSQIYNGTNTFTGSSTTTSYQISNTGVVSSTNILVQLLNPFNSVLTSMKSQFAVSSSAGQYGGFDNNAVSHTGFTFFPTAGTLTGGTVYVYGYRKS
jgi:hypothetical protein